MIEVGKAGAKLLSLVMSVVMVVSLMPGFAYADMALTAPSTPLLSASDIEEGPVTLTEGDVVKGFAPAGATCTSQDPSIAWVDAQGNLNALKEGATTITVASGADAAVDRAVTVEDYKDGSEVVGKLKLLVRYNDSMQFYDGHTYLLFTSYQDDVNITVGDLYGGYEISDGYYADIRESIANGSNHTGTDTDKYFTFNKGMKTMTLDRGEIVTIGMYRGFDLTVPQAALGSLMNSSLWTGIVKAGKEGVVNAIFDYLIKEKISPEEAFAQVQAVLAELGDDYTKWLDGVVEGGVCFNRELYNQKLEWDQYENVTYELDITKNQLNALALHLNGNLNKFSILKNSCATVALRGWNAAVGTRNGVDTAYKLDAASAGIYQLFDAPRGVRDNLVQRLPGYYLNNAAGVAEPDAGYQDKTGWVYVSAPEKVNPLEYAYEDDSLQLDAARNNMPALMKAANGGKAFSYNVAEQQVGVKASVTMQGGATTVGGFEFNVNGATASLDQATAPEGGIWLKAKVVSPQPGESYYALDADGNVLPSEYADGALSFCVSGLPATFKVVGSSTGVLNVLETRIVKAEDAKVQTAVYRKDGGEVKAIDDTAQVASGTKVYVKATFASDELEYALRDITMNGVSVCDQDHFDAEEGAYFAIMPERYSTLQVTYDKAAVRVRNNNMAQVAVGDTLDVANYALLALGEDAQFDSSDVEWVVKPEGNAANAVEVVEGSNNKQLKATAAGTALVWACAQSDKNIGVFFEVEVHESLTDMAAVLFSEENGKNIAITATYGEGDEGVPIPYSGYLVKKGSVLNVKPVGMDGSVISGVLCNQKDVKPNEQIAVNADSLIAVSFKSATVQGVPESVKIASKGDTYQLNASVRYNGLVESLFPVYDPSIRYESSDSLVAVDESGLITVTGDVPEGGKAVVVTAYAGSSGDTVFAQCRVEVGDYRGGKVVGRLTVSARRISESEKLPHGAATFTTYEDLDMDVSYYEYYKPNDKYKALMFDYEDNPQSYRSDPALYNNNELGLENRESYFAAIRPDAYSPAETIHLESGESISLSNYSFDATNFDTVVNAIKNGTISSSQDAQRLIEQVERYASTGQIDREAAFDSMVATIMEAYAVSKATGHNPMDGVTIGGLAVNREMYNQFRRSDSQFPNNYYTVEITDDELVALQEYLANPSNNYYSLFGKNCGSGACDIWNAALYDHPGLHLKASMTGFAPEPESLYFEIGLLRYKKGLPGCGGVDFCPRTIASTHKWTLRAEGNVLNAECVNDKIEHHVGACAYLHTPVALTLRADGCDYAHVAIMGLDKFNEVVGTSVAANKEYVKFYRAQRRGATSDGEEVAAGTNQEGFYYAELKVGGQVAKAAFTIGNPEGAEIVKAKNETALNKDCRIYITAKGVVKLKWGKVADADGYDVYARGMDGVSVFKKKAATVKSGKTTAKNLKKVLGKKVKTSARYRFAVKAYKMVDGKKTYLAKSNAYSAVSSANKKYANAKKVVAKEKKLTVAKGKTATIKTTVKKATTKSEKAKKLTTRSKKVLYFSSDTSVVKVSNKGKVTALKQGSCNVYCKAANGVRTVVKVTVK